jgi:hypothetical protein
VRNVLLIMAVSVGCAEPGQLSGDISFDSAMTDPIALVRVGAVTTIVIGPGAYERSLDGIFDGDVPTHFGWSAITVSAWWMSWEGPTLRWGEPAVLYAHSFAGGTPHTPIKQVE